MSLFMRVFALTAGSLLVTLASASLAWAEADNQDQAVAPVTITLQVPRSTAASITSINLRVASYAAQQRTEVNVVGNASPLAPAIVAASVDGNSLATIPVDASHTFDWVVSADASEPGCGPHPAAGTPGCRANGESGATSLEIASAKSSEFAGSLSTADTGAPISPENTPPITAPDTRPQSSPQRYTVNPGDTLIHIALHVYGSTDAVDQIAEANLGQPMSDGAIFSDPNQVHAGWTLSLPQPQPTDEVGDAAAARHYVVQPGDSLSSIAAQQFGSAERCRTVRAESLPASAPITAARRTRLQLPGRAATQ